VSIDPIKSSTRGREPRTAWSGKRVPAPAWLWATKSSMPSTA
jgi:hypothetical protein